MLSLDLEASDLGGLLGLSSSLDLDLSLCSDSGELSLDLDRLLR